MISDSPVVTIILTCFNHEDYVMECLNSVFKQTYMNIELIIINDGSTDKSESIIKNMISNSPFEKTTYVYQKNQGVCYTRNNGLNLVANDYLLFVDSDNYLSDNYIESLMDVALQTDADIIYGNLLNSKNGDIYLEGKEFNLQTFIERSYIDNCSLIKTSIVGNARYDLKLNRKKLVDYDFLLNLIINNNARPVYSPNSNFYYRILDDSISRLGNHSSEQFYYEVYFFIMEKYLSISPQKVYTGLIFNFNEVETRLSELILHLDKLNVYVEQLRQEQSDLQAKNSQQEINILNKEKELEISIFEKEKFYNDFLEIKNSKSYKIGNLIIKPLKKIAQYMKNPKLILLKCKDFFSKIFFLRTYFRKRIRNINRRKYKLSSNERTRRVLIFVIYEENEKLKEYKVIFLQALKQLCQRIVIVVNGSLCSEDIVFLENIGDVLLKDNVGYDTAAFRFGIQYLGKSTLKDYDELLLVNDTSIGPFYDIENMFSEMEAKSIDFWGITLGEKQNDYTNYNKYSYIPIHLQTYFLVVNKSLLNYDEFYNYWNNLIDTNSREKAVGLHETVFTKHFEDLGFSYDSVSHIKDDSAIYLHPLSLIKDGVPIIKYASLKNYDEDKFQWEGLKRSSEIPELLNFIKNETNYPLYVVEDLLKNIKLEDKGKYILIIDGVENIIPQCTRYRVLNKAEQLRSFGFKVKVKNLSELKLNDGRYASHIIIYRCGYTEILGQMCLLAKKESKTVLYDIDDLVIDTKFTDELEYTQNLNAIDKSNYDSVVNSYGYMMKLCDGITTSTNSLKENLTQYNQNIFLNRNLASTGLVEISEKFEKNYSIKSDVIKIGYFSGSISHNENFNLISNALLKCLESYKNIELHIYGFLDIPSSFEVFKDRVKVFDFIDWKDLPQLISNVDVNLAPLKQSIFNNAKSEIKWIEASLVKVPTLASNIGAFAEMIIDNKTGILSDDNEWFEKLSLLIESKKLREEIAISSFNFVKENCITKNKFDELVGYINERTNEEFKY